MAKKQKTGQSRRTASPQRQAGHSKAGQPKGEEAKAATATLNQADVLEPSAEGRLDFPVVGVGASAGGLKALKALLDAVPEEPGLALVIIQHLDPTKPSLTAELLTKHTAMPVVEVDRAMPVEADHVYVMPPQQFLSIAGGELRLTPPDRPRGARMPIDFFLRSLAVQQREKAVAVILSGTGADGTLGARAVKSQGGLVVAQDPHTADFSGMPESVIGSGTADFVLAPGDIPERLEEYRAANEEVLSINEELQSSNEEIETSKEELQSLNEELNTVNNQLAGKVGELESKTNDLANLLSSTDIATICLDRQFRINWFTPATARLMNLRSSDLGRPLADFSHRLANDHLLRDALRVLADLAPVETEVHAEDDRWYLRRILPYRTAEDRIDGVVITFVDVSDRRRADRLAHTRALAEQIVDTVREPMLVLDAALRVVSANAPFYRDFQADPSETVGSLVYDLGNGQWDIPHFRELLSQVVPGDGTINDFKIEHVFEHIGRRTMLLNARRIDETDMLLLAIKDVSGERQRFLVELNGRLRTLNDAQAIMDEAASAAAAHLGVDRAAYAEIGREHGTVNVLAEYCDGVASWQGEYPLSDAVRALIAELGESSALAIPDIHVDPRVGQLDPAVIEALDCRAAAAVPLRRKGALLAAFAAGDREPRRWSDDEVELLNEVAARTWAAVEAVRAEQALRRSEERFRTIFNSAAVGMAQVSPEGQFIRVNQKLCDMFGYSREELLQRAYRDVSFPDDVAPSLANVEQVLAGRADTFEMEKRHLRKDGKIFWSHLTVSAVRKPSGDVRYLVSIVKDITDRKRIEEELKALNDSLEEQVADRVELLSILQDVAVASNESETIEQAMRRALERVCDYNHWRAGLVLWVGEDVAEDVPVSGIWHAKAPADVEFFRQFGPDAHFPAGAGLIGQCIATGAPQWCDDADHFAAWDIPDPTEFGFHAAAAFPVSIDHTPAAILLFLSDRPLPREERFLDGMVNVGIELGHVIQRKRLEKAIADAVSHQQQRIGEELHDGVAQQLLGAAMMTEGLRQDLEEEHSQHAGTAAKLGGLIRKAQHDVRELAHGLVPVEVDQQGLMTALEHLAAQFQAQHEVDCRFECPGPVPVEDNEVALQMYRIAQESAYNALRHGKADRIILRLDHPDGNIRLEVEDNGRGMDLNAPQTGGMGIRIMRHRASLIGAGFQIDSTPGKGTKVECVLRRS